MFKENLTKKEPLVKEFWAQSQPIWAAHTRNHNMNQKVSVLLIFLCLITGYARDVGSFNSHQSAYISWYLLVKLLQRRQTIEIVNKEIFAKLDLPMFSGVMKRQENLTNTFVFSVFNKNLFIQVCHAFLMI